MDRPTHQRGGGLRGTQWCPQIVDIFSNLKQSQGHPGSPSKSDLYPELENYTGVKYVIVFCAWNKLVSPKL